MGKTECLLGRRKLSRFNIWREAMKIVLRHRKGRKVEYLNSDGKWKSTGKDTKREAKTWVEIFADQNNMPGCIAMRDFITDMIENEGPDSYISFLRSSGKMPTESTWNIMKTILRLYIIPRFGDFMITEISPRMIQNWIVTMKSKFDKPLASTYKDKILRHLGIVFDYAVFCGIIDRNPCRDIIGIRKVPVRKKKEFTDEELASLFPDDDIRLISIWSSKLIACYYMILRDTGWRPGEAAALTPANYIRSGHGIYTTRSVDSFTSSVKDRIKTSDSGYSMKIGILSDRTSALLEEIIEGMDDDQIIFTINGKLFVRSRLITTFNKALMACGIDIEGHCPYSFRVTFLTRASMMYPDSVVMEMMGHKNWHSCYDKRSPEELLEKLRKELADADSGREGNGYPIRREIGSWY